MTCHKQHGCHIMNFTREPILESIISARDGHKILVKSTKHSTEGEFFVDAVEVVSFGPQIFYRCLEKPRPFFLPASDFLIEEVKDQKVAIRHTVEGKNTKVITTESDRKFYRGLEKPRPFFLPASDVLIEEVKDQKVAIRHTVEGKNTKVITTESVAEKASDESQGDKGKNKDKRRRRGGKKESKQNGALRSEDESVSLEEESLTEKPVHHDELSSEVKARLLKPPEGLISVSLQKYRKELMEEEASRIPTSSDETYTEEHESIKNAEVKPTLVEEGNEEHFEFSQQLSIFPEDE